MIHVKEILSPHPRHCDECGDIVDKPVYEVEAGTLFTVLCQDHLIHLRKHINRLIR